MVEASSILSWYALNTKPHCELLVCTGLAQRGIESYLPALKAGRVGRETPFFPCYLFVHADLKQLGRSALQYLPGVRRLVAYDDAPVPVADALIEHIRIKLAELEHEVKDGRGQVLRHGDRVRITSGPLAGVDAVFDCSLSSHDRVRLLVDFIRRGASVEIDRGYIEKLKKDRLAEWARKQVQARY